MAPTHDQRCTRVRLAARLMRMSRRCMQSRRGRDAAARRAQGAKRAWLGRVGARATPGCPHHRSSCGLCGDPWAQAIPEHRPTSAGAPGDPTSLYSLNPQQAEHEADLCNHCPHELWPARPSKEAERVGWLCAATAPQAERPRAAIAPPMPSLTPCPPYQHRLRRLRLHLHVYLRRPWQAVPVRQAAHAFRLVSQKPPDLHPLWRNTYADSCNHATIKPCATNACNHATMQPCNHAAMQPCSHAAISNWDLMEIAT